MKFSSRLIAARWQRGEETRADTKYANELIALLDRQPYPYNSKHKFTFVEQFGASYHQDVAVHLLLAQSEAAADRLVVFAVDRLKVQQREAGVRHDLIDAVFALGGEDDLVRLLARVHALQAFLATPDGANLLAGAKRAANILRIEEAKDGAKTGDVDAALLVEPAESELAAALATTLPVVENSLSEEDFAKAMQALSALRAPVDSFFDAVIVNAPDPALRTNRLNLLNQLRKSVQAVADFSKIEG